MPIRPILLALVGLPLLMPPGMCVCQCHVPACAPEGASPLLRRGEIRVAVGLPDDARCCCQHRGCRAVRRGVSEAGGVGVTAPAFLSGSDDCPPPSDRDDGPNQTVRIPNHFNWVESCGTAPIGGDVAYSPLASFPTPGRPARPVSAASVRYGPPLYISLRTLVI